MSESIEQYIEETVAAYIDKRVTIEELRDIHGKLGEMNRRHTAGEMVGDEKSLRFMHQVTKGAIHRLSSRRKRDVEIVQARRRRKKITVVE